MNCKKCKTTVIIMIAENKGKINHQYEAFRLPKGEAAPTGVLLVGAASR
jgi:hypothetical protein